MRFPVTALALLAAVLRADAQPPAAKVSAIPPATTRTDGFLPIPFHATVLQVEQTGPTVKAPHWGFHATIDKPAPLPFRWETTDPGITAAEWEVFDTAAKTVVAQGKLNPPFTAGQMHGFTIDFTKFLPAKPTDTPRDYVVWVSRQAGGQVLPPSTTTQVTYAKVFPFDLDKKFFDRFEQNLRAEMTGKATGYQYAIYEGETLRKAGGDGWAVLNQVKMTADERQVVASMSKTVTAVAVMRAIELLKAKGVTVNSKVAPYLPTGWKLGPQMADLTIRDLLRHLSGIRSNGNQLTFDELRDLIAKGAQPQDWHVGKYDNSNFALFRVILPYMLHDRNTIEPKPNPKVKQLEDEIKDLQDQLKKAVGPQKAGIASKIAKLQAELAKLPHPVSVELKTAEMYVKFVQDEVLKPVGLGNITIAPRANDPKDKMVYYNFADTSKTFGGYSYDDALRHAGANFWVFSAKEYGKFIAGLDAGKIVSAPTVQQMKADQLGMYLGVKPFTPTTAGPNWNHNGGLEFGNKAGMQGDWMMLPKGVTCVVLVNSHGGVPGLLEEIIRPAWNKSW